MPWTTMALSMAAAMSLTLAAFHLRAWANDRGSRKSLLFSVVAIAAAATALVEAWLLYAQTPAEYGERLRWLHVPVATLVIGLAWLIPVYFQTGRTWLAWIISATRGVLLAANFSVPGNATFSEISGLRPVTFLGESLAIPVGVPSPWRLLADLSVLLLLVHALDAGISARKRRIRPRSLLLAGVIAYVGIQTAVLSRLMIEATVPSAFIGIGFALIVAVLFYDLSDDLIRSRQAYRDLQRSQRRMDLAAAAADLSFWEWEPGGGYLSFVGGSRDTAGSSLDPGYDLDRFLASVHQNDREEVRKAILRAITTEDEFQAQYRLMDEGGKTRWMSLQGSVERDGEGRAVLVRGASRDITPYMLAEAELNQKRSALTHLQRVTTLEHLSSSLAHELSQPLGAILRNGEAAELLLRDDRVDLSELRAIVTDLLADDRRAIGIIDRLRDLLKHGELNAAPLPIEPLVGEVEAMIQPDLLAQGTGLMVNIEPGLPPALADRVHVQQVLLNLLLNAAEAVRSEAPDRRIIGLRVRLDEEGALEFTVTDRGVGISPDRTTDLFEPFFSSKQDGIGLGLPISREIVEAHGGRIWMDANPEGGAIFRFTLPAARTGDGA